MYTVIEFIKPSKLSNTKKSEKIKIVSTCDNINFRT